ncbi:MAG: hypothetical protein KBB88_00285 [Candidatus Pacebacteria bacterium]|nr:hypothetical protein [Candidatus Paceibacterota bacterium]
MQERAHTIIFSHGFGVKKDDRGLFSGPEGIAESFQNENCEVVLFDYNQIDEEENTITTIPLHMQAQMLEQKIREVKDRNPDTIIDIIAHSQGCIAPAILLPEGIRNVVYIAPSIDANIDRMIGYFSQNSKTEINLDGVSKLARADGSSTYVTSEYWKERAQAHPIPLYTALAHNTKITIFHANDDTTLGHHSLEGIADEISVFTLDGDHNFTGSARAPLIEKIKKLLFEEV